MIRDIVLGIIPPGMFQKPVYTIVATATSCVVFWVLYLKKSFWKAISGKSMTVLC